ncbi:MAG: hypothetical protein M3011_03990 [Actinomycetota bacterium]|nr:hypothetical protein [Actinomycetota bacterium]
MSTPQASVQGRPPTSPGVPTTEPRSSPSPGQETGEWRVCAGRFAAGFCDVVDELLARPGALFDTALLDELARLLATDGPAAADAYRRLCAVGEGFATVSTPPAHLAPLVAS